MSQMHDLELAVRLIEDMLPDLPDRNLHKWHGIFTTALVKIEAEMNSTQMHRCSICGFEEYGYRMELPIAWRKDDDTVICFNHDDVELSKINKKEKEATTEKTLDELMAEL